MGSDAMSPLDVSLFFVLVGPVRSRPGRSKEASMTRSRRALTAVALALTLVPTLASAGVPRDSPRDSESVLPSLSRLWESLVREVNILWAEARTLTPPDSRPPGAVVPTGDCGWSADPNGGCRP